MAGKISAVCCTFRRYQCVLRVLNCFLQQDYQDKELIIYNTDTVFPYKTSGYLESIGIKIVNCDTDQVTGQHYTNVGAIRRDALVHATGDFVVTWDDDDMFMPWFMTQAMDRMQETGLPCFKPEKSFFHCYDKIELVTNTMEASVVADIRKVREYGYLLHSGKEGLAWYTAMRDNGELDEHDTNYVPSYCFDWGSGPALNARHKQSGDIDNPNNFDNHKAASQDVCNGPLYAFTNLQVGEMYKPYFEWLHANKQLFPENLFEKYVTSIW